MERGLIALLDSRDGSRELDGMEMQSMAFPFLSHFLFPLGVFPGIYGLGISSFFFSFSAWDGIGIGIGIKGPGAVFHD